MASTPAVSAVSAVAGAQEAAAADGATGEPVEGLYACGNNSGSFFSNNYPELHPGVACGRGMTEARHATLHALGMLDQIEKWQQD